MFVCMCMCVCVSGCQHDSLKNITRINTKICGTYWLINPLSPNWVMESAI
jgi:hypothetical protein